MSPSDTRVENRGYKRVMTQLTERPFQFGLASLFWLNLAVAVLLGSWRIGWWKVAATVAFISGMVFCILWVTLLIDELRR